MSTPVLKLQPHTIDGLVIQAKALVKKGVPPGIAVEQLFDPSLFSLEQLVEGTRRYLIVAINSERNRERGRGVDLQCETEDFLGPAPRSVPRLSDATGRLATLEYTVDGKPKRFLALTVDDLAHLASLFANHEAAYRRRRQFLEKTRALLEERRAKTVGDLPKYILKSLERDAGKVW